MKFGAVPVGEAEGAILAHSLLLEGRKLGKGVTLGAEEVAAIRAAGMKTVVVARLDEGDVSENEAAARLAVALVPDTSAARIAVSSPHAGRVNLNATCRGIVEIDAGRIQALNRVDPSLTLATLAPWMRVAPGMLVGTVKIIAYAVSGAALEGARAAASGAIRVRPVTVRSAGLILSSVDASAGKLSRKGEAAVAGRLDALGIELADVRRVPHTVEDISGALGTLGGEMALILTGAATSDIRDVAPEAVRRAGGHVARFGMPVDPGNLLFHGTLAGRPVIGLPGCARSPALNGADWVLERLACGLDVSEDDIARMGVGGLLKEIPIRPKPREGR